MAAAGLDERPRQLAIPTPTPMHTAARKAAREETVKALREKLSEYQAENNLLGTLVKELKADRDGLHKKFANSVRQHQDASSKAATAVQQVEAGNRDHKRLTAELERLSSVVHSHSVRLQKAKQHQQELEDVALDLRAELDEARAQQDEAEKAAAASAQRATAAEAKLEAAGLGAMPKMGPTAEQLVINSTQRIRELSEELEGLRAEHRQQLADAQEQLRQQDQEWQQQLEQARAAAQDTQQQLEQQLQQQAQDLQQQARRSQTLEQQCTDLQEQVMRLQQSLNDAQQSAQASADLQRTHQLMASSNQSLQQQVTRLQQQLTEREAAHAAALAEQQQATVTLQREKQELTASLAVLRQHESAHRLSAAEAGSKIERLRGELLRCVGELQAQLAASATAGQQQQQLQQQLRAMEATAGAARAEAAETRQQLVELASATLTELREQVAGEAVATTGLPEELDAAALPGPVATYLKVLEHAVCDCERRSKQLLSDSLSAQQHEREVRQVLAAAREAQAAAERALQQQTQRLLAAERMRLSDLKEQQSLEKRLALAQHECASLRDVLLNRASSATSQQQQLQQLGLLPAGSAPSGPAAAAGATAAGATAAGAGGSASASPAAGSVGAAGPRSPTSWALGLADKGQGPFPGAGGGGSRGGGGDGGSSSNNPAGVQSAVNAHQPCGPGAAGAWGGSTPGHYSQAGLPGSSGAVPAWPPTTAEEELSLNKLGYQPPPSMGEQQQQQQQQQGSQPGLWHIPAADAGHAGADAAAASASTANRYQAKLAQLRQMKEQLMRRTCGDTSNTTATQTLQPQEQQQQQQQGQGQEQQMTLSLQLPSSLPPPSAVVWTPRSVNDSWLIGCGSSGGLRTSQEHCGVYSSGGISSMAHSSSSSGGGSHLSSWSNPGRGPPGVTACGGGGGGGGWPVKPSRLGVATAPGSAALDGMLRDASGPAGSTLGGGSTQLQPPRGSQGMGVGDGSMKDFVKAVTKAAGSSSPGRGSLSGRDRGRQGVDGGGGSSGPGREPPGPAAHGLGSRSHLQRWAQPPQQEEQRQGRQQVLTKQRSSSGRRTSGSTRSSEA